MPPTAQKAGSLAGDVARGLKVLILGDGDFSFAASVAAEAAAMIAADGLRRTSEAAATSNTAKTVTSTVTAHKASVSVPANTAVLTYQPP